MIKDKDEQVAKLKSAIIEILDIQSMHYHMIADILDGSFKPEDLATIGNCLRVLKKSGYIKDFDVEGTRWWKRTSIPFDSDPPVKVLVPFSARTHQKVAELADKSGRSRVSIIKELVRSGLDL